MFGIPATEIYGSFAMNPYLKGQFAPTQSTGTEVSGAAAEVDSTPASGTKLPAYFWVGFVIVLVLIRIIYEMM